MLVYIRHDIEKQILRAYHECRSTRRLFSELTRHRKMAEVFRILLANGALHNEPIADIFDLTCDTVSKQLTSAKEANSHDDIS